jgi:hypothetical protein
VFLFSMPLRLRSRLRPSRRLDLFPTGLMHCKMIGETFKRWGLFALHCLLTRPASGPIVVETRNSGLARRGRN